MDQFRVCPISKQQNRIVCLKQSCESDFIFCVECQFKYHKKHSSDYELKSIEMLLAEANKVLSSTKLFIRDQIDLCILNLDDMKENLEITKNKLIKTIE